MGASGSKAAASEGLKHCTLWKADRSPACRSVLMTLDALNLSVNEIDLNMDKEQHKSAEIAAMNKLQTLPILRDQDLVLTDSHCINTYLAARYNPSEQLLPKEPGGRARVEQLLLYNCGVLQPRFKCAAYPIMYENFKCVLPHETCEVESAYGDLEKMLAGNKFFGGQCFTLGDISIMSTVSTLNLIVPIDKSRFPKLCDWHQRMSQEMFCVTANAKGLSDFSRRIGDDYNDADDKSNSNCSRTSIKRRSLTAGSTGAAPLKVQEPPSLEKRSKESKEK